jgi:hypothetical protein
MKIPLLLAGLCLLGHEVSFAQDTEGPRIAALSIAPDSVDVSDQSRDLAITLQVTDNDSGFAYANLFVYTSAGDFVTNLFFTDDDVLPGGDANDGTYEVPLTIPRYAPPGALQTHPWRIDASLVDREGNTRDYSPTEDALPVPDDAKFEVINTGIVDELPPEVISLTASESSVDVTETSATIDFNFEVEDDLSGLRLGFVNGYAPGGLDFAEISYFFSPQDVLPPGDALAGEYQLAIELEAGAPAGNWSFTVSGWDLVGNYFESEPVFVTVESAAGQRSPFLAMALDALHLAPESPGKGWFYQTDETRDGHDAAASGMIGDDEQSVMRMAVEGPGTLHFAWRVDSEAESDFLSVGIVDGPGGIAISGLQEWISESIEIPPGVHQVAWIYAKDEAGSAGADRGWVDQVLFEAAADLEPPRLQELAIGPRAVELSDGPASVDFEIEVSDDLSGFSEGTLSVYSFSGDLVESFTFTDSENIEGDEKLGRYSVNLEIPEDVAFGPARVELELTDFSGKSVIYGEGGEAFPSAGSEELLFWDGESGDGEAPQVRALEVTPGTVEVSGGNAFAAVTLRVTDSGAGFSFGSLSVINPDGGYTGATPFGEFDLISGDLNDGIYRVEIEVPRYGKEGTWRVECYVEDRSGNWIDYPISVEFPDEARPVFSVVNSEPVDGALPFVTSLSVSPTSIDTGSGPAAVEVTVVAGDALSGLRDALLYFYNPAGVFQGVLFTDLQAGFRTEGDEFAGTYKVTRMLPQGSMPGQWSVRLFLRDRVGNASLYGLDFTPLPAPSDGLFTVTSGAVPSLFSAFVAGASLTGNDALHGADPDKDGRNNATELLLGTGPADAADAGAGLIWVSRDATAVHLNFTVDPSLTAATSGQFLELRNGGGGAPLRLTGQSQGALGGSWTNLAPEFVAGSTWRVSLPLASGPAGFLRLFFEEP